MKSTMVFAAVLAALLTGAPARGANAEEEAAPVQGLVGEYFVSDGQVQDFPPEKPGLKPFLVRVDKQVKFAAVKGEFYGTKLTDNFWARWTGSVRAEKAGAHTFYTESDDGSRLWIDGRLVVDNGGRHGMVRKSGEIEFAAGSHEIKLLYFEAGGDAGCILGWKAQGGTEETIPAGALSHAAEKEKIAWDEAAWKKAKVADPAPAKRSSKNDTERITEALPEKARVTPAKTRKLLVFTRCNGFRHGSIPTASKALELMGQKTGAYETVVTDDVDIFEPEKLEEFDAVCMNNTTGDFLQIKGDREKETRLKKSLLDFVSGGKGIAGIHAATDWKGWKEYGEMMGGQFSGHPWHCKVGIKLDDPAHELTAVFEGKNFEITDEIYQFNRGFYSHDKLRELLSLDMTKTQNRGKRKDQDYAVSWVRSYGKGRVFYCSLGHRNEIFWNPVILRYYLDGVQFALGDLPADTTPTAKLKAAPEAGAEGWKSLFNGKDLVGWKTEGNWVVGDGVVKLEPRKGEKGWTRYKAYLWAEKQFKDFVLDLEFKLEKGTNSGVFFRVENPDNPVRTGLEVQINDTHGRKGRFNDHTCGGVIHGYPPTGNPVRPPGQWNRFIITCKEYGTQVELNGERIIDITLEKQKKTGRNRQGYIGFQDHGLPVSFRNIRIREL